MKLRKSKDRTRKEEVLLRTCPECGSVDIYYEGTGSGERVICKECGHSGPSSEVEVRRASPKGEGPKEVIALQCPVCGGTDLFYEMGMIGGEKYRCKDCQYVGAFALERRVIVDEDGNIREV